MILIKWRIRMKIIISQIIMETMEITTTATIVAISGIITKDIE